MVAVSAIMMKSSVLDSDFNPSAQKVLISTSALIWLALISILRHASREFAVFVGASIKVRYDTSKQPEYQPLTHCECFYLTSFVKLKICMRLLSFILASFIILLAFATMFYLSVVMSDQCKETLLPYLHFCTLSKSLLKSYVLFVGSIEEGSFDGYGYDIPQQTVVLLAIFAFVVVVLLLNM